MSKTKPTKPKAFQLNDEELSEIVFYTRVLKEKQISLRLWEAELKKAQIKAEGRFGADPSKYVFDWSKVFETGQIYKHVMPQSTPNAEQQLQEKQSKGNKNKK